MGQGCDKVKDEHGMQKQYDSLGSEERGSTFKKEKKNLHGCSLATYQREREEV